MKKVYIKKTGDKIFVENESEIIGGAQMAKTLQNIAEKMSMGRAVKVPKTIVSALGLALNESFQIEDRTQ